jgi:hypothetical protein
MEFGLGSTKQPQPKQPIDGSCANSSKLRPEQAANLLTFAILICEKCWTGWNSNDATAIRVSLAAEAFAASAEIAAARLVARLRVPGRIAPNY